MQLLGLASSKISSVAAYTVKPVLSGHSKRRQKIGFQNQLSLNTGQKFCRMLQKLPSHNMAMTCYRSDFNHWHAEYFDVLHSSLISILLTCTGFIQGNLCKIQGLLKTLLQFSRTKSLGKILIKVLKFFFKLARRRY